MSTMRLQIRRGTSAQTAVFTGAEGELSVDTTDWSLRVHDGLTPGGASILTTSDGSGGSSASPDGTTIISNDGGTTFSVAYGTTANTAAEGNDSRITGALSSATAATTYAPLASPAFTGTPTVPTASVGTNTTQIASTAFVLANSSNFTLPIATSSILGGVKPDGTTLTNTSGVISVTYGTTANTAAQGNDSRITGALSSSTAATTYAPIDSPTFTGTPVVPTATVGTNTTQAASTAFVLANSTNFTLPIATSSVLGGVKPDGTTLTNTSGVISVTYGTTANTAAQGNDSRITGALSSTTAASTYAPLASPTFTGTPVVPTATASTNTTQAASTAFVKAAIDNLINGAPGTLDTLGEIATQLSTDESAATALVNAVALKAPIASPTFTGTVTIPAGAAISGYLTTSSAASTYQTALGFTPYNSTNPAGYQTASQVTAVLPIASTATPLVDGTATVGTSTSWSHGDHIHPTDTSRAPVASPTFTGTVTIPGGSVNATIGGTTPAPATFTTLFITSLPTDPTGLPIGQVWNNGGLLCIVQ